MVDRQMIEPAGQLIRDLRNRRVWSPGTLAEKAGISAETLRLAETGRRKRINFLTIAKIAKALGVRPETLIAGDAPRTRVLIKNKRESTAVIIGTRQLVVFYSRLIISTVETALDDHDTNRKHNQPPSELIIEDKEYIAELRHLVAELRRLNELLETVRSLNGKARKPVIDVKKHVDTFLNKWAGTIGVGTGLLTVGAMVALLNQLGVGDAVLEPIIKKLPGLR
jgi:transcriptional regulator with XRE-family HTH domain